MGNDAPRSLIAILAALGVAGAVSWAGSQGGVWVFGVPLFALCGALAFVINGVAFVPAFAAQTERYYDAVGALTHLSLVVCGTVLGGTPDARALLLAGLVSVWALRLGSFLFARIRREGSDGRFDAIKPDFLRFAMAWTLQALWVLLTSGCALAAITSVRTRPLGVWALAGTAIFCAGFAIEVAADRQKRVFRADPANRGRFIASGLWAWSRHPNYLGEIVLWVGVAIVAFPVVSGWQLVTLGSPVFVFLLLTRVSGIPLLEARAKQRWGDDPAYRAYVERTPLLWLRPPGV